MLKKNNLKQIYGDCLVFRGKEHTISRYNNFE